MVPLLVVSYMFRGKSVISPENIEGNHRKYQTTRFERNFMFYAGIGLLCLVPLFKTLTHLPPFMGILFALGLLWLVGDLIHRYKVDEDKQYLTLGAALQRIDMSSLVFFIGILLAVATLEHSHILAALAQWLDKAVGSQAIIVSIFGLASAIVDNVPLVAASMGMYSIADYPQIPFCGNFSLCCRTGGSILIIGSAAGVAAMGIEKIEFFWYVRKITPLALVGYFAGAVAYIFMA